MPNVSIPVDTSTGREAATWTSSNRGLFDIWRKSGTDKWSMTGHTTYPHDYITRCVPAVSSAVVNGARDATFIVRDCFTGDGGANAAAIANGPKGWGLLQQIGTSELASSGIGGASGLKSYDAVRWDMEFEHGRLVTIDRNGFFAVAGFGLFPRVRLWRWTGAAFVVTRDSGYTAAPTTLPDPDAASLPAGACPANGTYRADFGARFSYDNPHITTNPPIELVVVPPSAPYPGAASCTPDVYPWITIAIRAAHTSAPLTSFRRGRLTNRRWITAPAWFLLLKTAEGWSPAPLFGDEMGSSSPYRVPRLLGVNEVVSYLGDPPGYRPVARRKPASGTVTFSDGVITWMTVN